MSDPSSNRSEKTNNSNDQHTDSEQTALAEFGEREADRVWSRYNVMVIANSIFLGFLTTSSNSNDEVLFIFTVAGALVTFLWLIMTSTGWSLSEEWSQKSMEKEQIEPHPHEVYQDWLQDFGYRNHSFTWWSAHGVILVFLSGYCTFSGMILFRMVSQPRQAISILFPLGMFILVCLVWWGLCIKDN